MNRPLIKKYIAEGVLLFVALALGVFASFCFRLWVVGELDTDQFQQIIDLLPKDWRKFATVDFDWLVSYLGRTSLTLNGPMLISLVCCVCSNACANSSLSTTCHCAALCFEQTQSTNYSSMSTTLYHGRCD